VLLFHVLDLRSMLLHGPGGRVPNSGTDEPAERFSRSWPWCAGHSAGAPREYRCSVGTVAL